MNATLSNADRADVALGRLNAWAGVASHSLNSGRYDDALAALDTARGCYAEARRRIRAERNRVARRTEEQA